jgi:uncharacterized protein YecE (DUF72 family)
LSTQTNLVRLGTSSWSCEGWRGTFYPPGTNPRDFIAAYARTFNTVEIDSTFYAIPRKSTVEGWRDRTSPDFIFAAKAPQVITHEKCLVQCDSELRAFLETMTILDSRLGPVLFQFPYFNKASGMTSDLFLQRLEAFLPSLPEGFQWAVEVRNKTWIGKPLLELLGEHAIPLALIDHPWMARPEELFAKNGILTGSFAYIRWLGDRYAIEKVTTTWNETVVDRRKDLEEWAPHIVRLCRQQCPVYGYVNNHYAGYAPGTLDLLTEILEER